VLTRPHHHLRVNWIASAQRQRLLHRKTRHSRAGETPTGFGARDKLYPMHANCPTPIAAKRPMLSGTSISCNARSVCWEIEGLTDATESRVLQRSGKRASHGIRNLRRQEAALHLLGKVTGGAARTPGLVPGGKTSSTWFRYGKERAQTRRTTRITAAKTWPAAPLGRLPHRRGFSGGVAARQIDVWKHDLLAHLLSLVCKRALAAKIVKF
jgi:hypothetical protein